MDDVMQHNEDQGEAPELTLNAYQTRAISTAIFPGRGQDQLIYPAIALVEEAGELAGKVYHQHMEGEYATDPELQGPLTLAMTALLLAWNCGNILGTIKKAYRNDPQGMLNLERIKLILDDIERLKKSLLNLKLVVVHGGPFEFPPVQVKPESKEDLINEVGDIMWYTACFCTEMHASMARVAEANLTKLADRKRRGVIGGTGDNR
jgi:NTP pyrophosphatase (non-canonical NTP hydrolase)